MTPTQSSAESSDPSQAGTFGPDQAAELVASVRAVFDSGRTRDLDWRQAQLEGLIRFLDTEEEALLEAMAVDMAKPRAEAWAADIGTTRGEVEYLAGQFRSWARPRRVRLPVAFRPGRGRVDPQPKGVALVIAPWNYPVQLVIEPLAAALAAGNAVVVKPSELAPATAAVLAGRLSSYIDPDAVRVVEGGVPETTALLRQRFDHIFFTGSTAVGKVVMRAAAEHLTPVTLELGGKSPVVVDRSADLRITARRIVWGKFLNAGQTCIAPDYVLVENTVRDELLDRMVREIGSFYGRDPESSGSYARVVNERHLARLTSLLAGEGSGRVVTGGKVDPGERYLAPTIVVDPDPDSPLMTEEIFGPILPVLGVEDVDEAIAFVNSRERPLALYVFTAREAIRDRVLGSTISGGACVNHTLLHVAPSGLPFGGVGPSGMGSYHGRAGFDEFSHHRSIMIRPFKPDVRLLYPPYNTLKEKLLRRFL
ncbi:MAG TPA: aldehyde dehydrogenase family protein [Acidimicrobiales bacterium]|nr:aldehyde dehydrogenase family protein [Acidimicrobiales bacterium]